MSNQDKIRALSEREKAREKLPVFYGSYDNYYHGFREVLNNAVDEILNNFEDGIIDVVLHDDNRTIAVKDTGRGMPITNQENVSLLFETLFASGKYDVTSKTNSGVNGVGNTILMYSSEYFKCTSHTQGKIYEIEYENGGEVLQPLTCCGDTNKHGTKITFRLDDSCYTETVFDYMEVESIIRRVSMISEHITFNFTYKNGTKTFKHSISEYFDLYSNDIIGSYYAMPIGNFTRKVEVERKGAKDYVDEYAEIQLVFGACSSEEPLQETMLNGNYLKEGGTIFDGVLEGFKIFINKYCKDNNLYKKNEKGITNQDISDSISFVCRVFNNLVEFESQVKFSTKKEYYKQVAKDYIQEQLEVYKLENGKDFKRLVDQVLICKRANDVNIKSRQALKKKLTDKVDSVNNRVDGFVDCELDKGGEIFLVEGKSANGSIVLARDSYFQASYPLRGKLLNLLKANWKNILNNNEITDIIQLFECGVEVRNKYTKDLPQFDLEKLRWDKIILTADADSDGRQINVLMLVAIYVLFPTLIKKGYVYIAQPPIFQIDCQDERKFAMTVREKDDIVKSFGNKKVEIHRLKGLGETSAEVMAQTVCNPETRVLQQVTVQDVEEMMNKFRIWMDDEVKDRKEIITNNLNKYLIDPPILEVTSEKDIVDIVEDNIMEYASDVIFDRALVSIESGTKPSQLRSIFAMYKNNVTKLTKSKNVTGYVTQYHPHGSAYDTIVNMCQNDRHLNPLIDYEGNMGQHTSKDLMAADERYTNIKLSKIALDGLKEIDSHFVEMINTYDNKRKMPLYLPNKYPLVLTQSTQGMAVGMASKTPSFNMDEVNNAIITYIKENKKTILIPDFATGGKILNHKSAFESINEKGKGSVRLRGSYFIEDNSVVFYEVPYGVRREEVIDKTIASIKDGKLKECVKVKDLTDLKGMKIKFEFKKNTNMDTVVEKLFKLTPLESSFDCNMNVLYKGLPSVNGVWEIIDKWITFRKECLVNGIDYQLSITAKELHKLEGFEKIVDDLDRVIEIIRFSKNVRNDLKNEFSIDDTQSEYIEKSQLVNINELAIKKQIEDIANLRSKIETLTNNKNDDAFLCNLIVQGLKYILKEFPTPRRTEIVDRFEKFKTEELLIEDYNCVCYLTNEGYFKKVKTIANKGTNKLKDGDDVKTILECSNKDELLVFCEDLCCYKFKLHDIEETKLSNLGQYLFNETKSKVLGMSVLNDTNKYMLVVYKNGSVAKISLSGFETKQNRKSLSKSLHSSDVIDIITLVDDIEIDLVVNDGRVKRVNTSELTLNKSRNSSGAKQYTWKNQEVVEVKIVEKDVDNVG